MSQGYSEKAHRRHSIYVGSNLVYCATNIYTCIYKRESQRMSSLCRLSKK